MSLEQPRHDRQRLVERLSIEASLNIQLPGRCVAR